MLSLFVKPPIPFPFLFLFLPPLPIVLTFFFFLFPPLPLPFSPAPPHLETPSTLPSYHRSWPRAFGHWFLRNLSDHLPWIIYNCFNVGRNIWHNESCSWGELPASLERIAISESQLHPQSPPATKPPAPPNWPEPFMTCWNGMAHYQHRPPCTSTRWWLSITTRSHFFF